MKLQDWSDCHFYFVKTGADRYYQSLAKRIEALLATFKENIPPHISSDFLPELAFMAAAYVEDQASGFGVWRAFVSVNRRRCGGAPLPFFDYLKDEEEEYLEEEINLADIRFITWYALLRVQSKFRSFFNPISDLVESLAVAVYYLLVDVWEEAPEASRAAEKIHRHLLKADWGDLRPMMEWLNDDCYLTAIPGNFEKYKGMAMGPSDNNTKEEIYKYHNKMKSAVTTKLAPFGMTAAEIMGEMAANLGNAERGAAISSIKLYDETVYDIMTVNRDTVEVRCKGRLMSKSPFIGSKFEVVKRSFSNLSEIQPGAGMMASLLTFNGEAFINGLSAIIPQYSNEKDPEVKVFDDVLPLTQEDFDATRRSLEEIVKKNGGSPFFFVSSMAEFFERTGMAEKVKNIGDGFPENINVTGDLTVFIDTLTCRTDIDSSVSPLLKSKRNPFYSKDEASLTGAWIAIITRYLSEEACHAAAREGMFGDAVMACSQGRRIGKALLKKNLSFIIDFLSSGIFQRNDA